MGSSNIRDVLTSFSPSLDLFAVSFGDGRIKIWDTAKGQLQTEFTDIASTETSIFGKQEQGHLSMDYTCMKWLSLDKRKKRKLGGSLLVLGTGGGDVLALDVSAGQLKWRIQSCHPGGVAAISFAIRGSHVYTSGADGMVCEIDAMSGNLVNKFSAAPKALSCLSVSPDGKMIATAAAQLKIFNSSNHEKLQRFSGHPAPVKCMVFSEDGKYVLSSALGERYVAVWQIDGSKNKTACLSLAMDHPAVFLEAKSVSSGNADSAGLSIVAVSEVGVCYFWHGKTIDELRNSKPTKISLSSDDEVQQKNNYGGGVPYILAGKLQAVSDPACGHLFLAYGLLIKPSFEKVLVQYGTDVILNVSRDGILLPISQSRKSKKASERHGQVTALNRANTEGALLPVPMALDRSDTKSETKPMEIEDKDQLDSMAFCMEEKLKSLGILRDKGDTVRSSLNFLKGKGIDVDTSMLPKKVRAAVSSIEPNDTVTILKSLMDVWLSRSCNANNVLPWIYRTLMYHGEYIRTCDTELISSLNKVATSKLGATNSLLRLYGRLQLVSAQIDKGSSNNRSLVSQADEGVDNESEDEDVEDVVYGVDDSSQTSSENDD